MPAPLELAALRQRVGGWRAGDLQRRRPQACAHARGAPDPKPERLLECKASEERCNLSSY